MKLLVVSLLGFLVASCSTQDSGSVVSAPVAFSYVSGSHQGRIFELINSKRQAAGLPAFLAHAGLDRVARQHAEYLRDHRGRYEAQPKMMGEFASDARGMMYVRNYHMRSVEEAFGLISPSEIPKLWDIWQANPDFKFALEQPWDYSGVGIAECADGALFVVQVFANPLADRVTVRDWISYH